MSEEKTATTPTNSTSETVGTVATTKIPAAETVEENEAVATETTSNEETNNKEVPEEKLPGAEILPIDVKTGMTIRVHERVKDINAKGEERERIQIFQGMVIGVRGAGISKTMTIHREQKGYEVEKIYPLTSPVITKIELVKTAKVRRAQLSYLQHSKNRFNHFKRKLKEKWVKI